MAKWELALYVAHGGAIGAIDISSLTTKRDKETGNTAWNDLTDMATDGWELVSVTPIALGGTTTSLLFSFKRPQE